MDYETMRNQILVVLLVVVPFVALLVCGVTGCTERRAAVRRKAYEDRRREAAEAFPKCIPDLSGREMIPVRYKVVSDPKTVIIVHRVLSRFYDDYSRISPPPIYRITIDVAPGRQEIYYGREFEKYSATDVALDDAVRGGRVRIIRKDPFDVTIERAFLEYAGISDETRAMIDNWVACRKKVDAWKKKYNMSPGELD